MDTQLFDVTRLFFGDIVTWHFFLETVIRIGLLFTCTLLVFHFLYRKDIVEFTSTELIVMLVLGTIIGDTAFYHSVPLIHSFIALAATVMVARFVAFVGKRSERLESLVNGKTVLVIQDGYILNTNLALLGYNERELLSLLRLQGIAHTNQVAYAFIETSGHLSVIKNERPSDKGVSTIDLVLK